MTIFIDLVVIAFSIAALWIGAVWVVTSASKLAKKLGLSELVIGLTIVAIATSAPEFAVTVVAAINGQSAISVGNVIGSNIFNLGIILGIVSIFSVMQTDRKLLYRDGSILIFCGLILLWFYYDLVLEFHEGIILFILLVGYVIYLIKTGATIEEEIPEGEFTLIDIPKLIVGIALIILAADFLVDSASEIARVFGLSEWMIGVTIVAAGTSIPELATSVVAVIKGRHGISAGNLIGSDIFNMLGVLGVASIIRPLTISEADYTSLILLAVSMVVLFIILRTNWKITKLEGMILILIALARWSIVFIN